MDTHSCATSLGVKEIIGSAIYHYARSMSERGEIQAELVVGGISMFLRDTLALIKDPIRKAKAELEVTKFILDCEGLKN